MFHMEPNRWTTSLQPHWQRWFDSAATQVLSGLDPHGPVVYASEKAGAVAKEHLVRRLLTSLLSLEPGCAPGPNRWPVILGKTAMGQPLLRLEGQPGPAVSFSQTSGCLWAALAPAGQVGLDATHPSEFEGDYPFARAFRAAELGWARTFCWGDTSHAAALLWALKEAAVKALGVGFHFLDPLEVEAFSPRPWQGGLRVSLKVGKILSAWARPAGDGWLAIARNS